MIRSRRAAAALLVALIGCDGTEPPADPTTCELANERMGETVCVESVATRSVWEALALDAPQVDIGNALKYLVPVDESAPLPAMFVNSQRFKLHYDFLLEVFPEHYAAMTWAQYVAMVISPPDRVYWGGDVSEYLEAGGKTRFGFIVWDDPADEASMPSYDDVLYVWRELQPRFSLDELMFVPASQNQREAVASWTSAPFAIRGEDHLTYEAYNEAVGFGTLRLQPLDTLEADSLAGGFGYQDLLVLDEAPMDLSRVVSGVVTGTRQAALSHVNVRMSTRGTPNCYTAEPWTKLAGWEGQLVRLECAGDALLVSAATTEEAEAWWTSIRPDPVTVEPPDTEWTALVPLLDVPTDTETERHRNFLRFGAKGANLATLYQRIDPGPQFDGFLIPFALYSRFLDHRWAAPVADGTEALSFAETIAAWHADPAFLTNAALRSERLAALRAAMLAAPVDPADLLAIRTMVEAEFGGGDVMVRFRSSSNAEDGVVFSGAGLYDSVSACVADELDDDSAGPSRCDDDKDEEKLVADALRAVWASTWNSGAWEERAWYGMEQADVAMAILVNDQSEREQANIVAFTGNPTNADTRWLVEAQAGDIDVVAAEAGVSPERTLLTVMFDAVTGIERVDGSSEVPEGEFVLSDARLYEVGALLAEVEAVMPHDGALDGLTFLWDTEQKLLDDGRLVIKQVRPFARGE